MRITESQLRRIIQEEVQALREMGKRKLARSSGGVQDSAGSEVFTITLPNADGLGANLGLYEGALGFVEWLKEVGAKYEVSFGLDAYDPNTDTVQGFGTQADLMALAAELDRTPNLNDFLGGHGASFETYISSDDPDENRLNFQY